MTCATPRASERAASNRMNSCARSALCAAAAAPQMKLEGIQYESSLFLLLSFFLFLQTVAHRDVRLRPPRRGALARARGHCLKDEPGGKKAKVPLDSAFQKRREDVFGPPESGAGAGGGENIPRACRYILKRAETFVSESSMRWTTNGRTDGLRMDRWTCGATEREREREYEDKTGRETGSLHFCCTASRYAAADKK